MNNFETLLDSLEATAGVPASGEMAIHLLEHAEKACAGGATWRRYLDLTGNSNFLQALPERGHRYRWAETCFRAIVKSGYTVGAMLQDRARKHPERLYLRETTSNSGSGWTYSQIALRLRAIAAMFCAVETEPRVAIFSENSVGSACCDLACLVHRIFDTPLSVHFDAATLSWIFDRLAITIAVADTDARIQRLCEVRSKTARAFRIYQTGTPGNECRKPADAESLDDACARFNLDRSDALLDPRRDRPLTDAATVMFTSGSTGAPKGIVFTQYHLVAKRFARAAAWPGVGNDEVLLCYLPLFHTFGRYLEMLGTLYWGGTYVFAGNPSVETLIAQMQEVRPTGLISVPLRWIQIRDHCVEMTREAALPSAQTECVRRVVGDRLRWGLSAAGHLDPGVFRFFQRFGIDLCSGFGMTEATGGITMTAPGEYVDGTVGIPLPGVRVRFGAGNELEISGDYVARYLEEGGSAEIPPQDPGEVYWLSTGDVFKTHPGDNLEIIDRVKDIYKNNRGQTIAPRRVETKFDGVPGIKRVFLVGDARDCNVLLIVPDRSDPVLQMPEAGVRDYLHQIVASANASLTPFERVVNFALLDRDFELDRGELTPKGSYRRKMIEENFAAVIERLYKGNFVDLTCGDLRVRIPRWFYRDLSLLETDITAGPEGLVDSASGRMLRIEARPESGAVRIGDLEYRVAGSTIDLGLFARQPRLWVGNASLAAFCPVKDGWDLPLTSVAPQIQLPWRRTEYKPDPAFFGSPTVQDARLRRLHRSSVEAFFSGRDSALEAVNRLGEELHGAEERIANLIRRRLEALARHPAENMRCLAYRILLLDEPMPDYGRVFPSFVDSGMTFLNGESICAIATSGFGDKRLQSLRQRLFSYRNQLAWPAAEITRGQFEKIFSLLADFAARDSSYLGPVRAELASWALHRSDPLLAAAAESCLTTLNQSLEAACAPGAGESVARLFVFEDGLPPAAVRNLEMILGDGTFLKQSVMLAFDEEDLDYSQVAESGIWISRVLSQHRFDLYRCGMNLRNGKHFDLLIVSGEAFADAQSRDTIYWLMAISEHPSRAHALPRFGACRPDLNALSVAYVSDLSMWEKVREFACAQTVRAYSPRRRDWRRIFVRGMAAFLTVWQSSGERIVPGAVTPANVVVPDADFREAACILSLTGWRHYENPLSLVAPFIRNFYRQTAAHYPKAAQQIELRWIFDACLEALGSERGSNFLMELEASLPGPLPPADLQSVARALAEYRERLRERPYQPLPLLCAIDRFDDWSRENPEASSEARAEEVEQLYWLYRLDRFPEIFRYRLYSRTYFARSGEPVNAAFDRLLNRLIRQPCAPAPHLEELYELQAALGDVADREVFSRMVFPRARREQRLEVMEVGGSDHKRVIVRSRIGDRRGVNFAVRDPVSPAEIGHLYRLLHESNYPKRISEQEQHLVVTDDGDQVIGGLTWLPQTRDVVYLSALVVAPSLRGRGIASALVEDFCVRMTARGTRLVKTDFLIRRFYQARDFHVDARWGGLVRHLIPASSNA